MHHLTGQAVWVAQEPHSLLHLSLLQELPNVGRAYRHPVQRHLRQHIAADPPLPAFLLEPLWIACALVAKVEIIAADQMLCLQLPVQICFNKYIPGHMHHGLVKMRQDDIRNAKAAIQNFFTILDGVNQ